MALVENELVERLHQKADREHIPISGVFEISPVCNMNCRMCYVKKTLAEVNSEGGLLSMEQWLNLAEQAKQAGTLFILITGGEPFFRKDFKELYSKLHEMGFVLSINSNGTMINKDTLEWLKQMPPSRINITLYGAHNSTYERLCGNPCGFDQVTNAIDLLQSAGITVKLNASITQYNQSDLEEMIAYAASKGLILETTAYMFPPLRKDREKIGVNDRLSAEEATDIFNRIMILQHGKEYVQEYCRYMHDTEQEIAEHLQKNPVTKSEGVSCRAGSCTYWITWDGRMLPCGMMVEPIAYPLKENFLNAWKQIRELTDNIRLPLECSNCSKKEICHTCAAMIYAETGAYDKVPEYRCKMTEHYYESCENQLNR